jgi:hypothetical protein
MSKTEKILVLYNEFEATLMESILDERGIPCMLKSYYDSAYDGMWQAQKGWGQLDADPKHREEILMIYAEISRNQTDGDQEEQE